MDIQISPVVPSPVAPVPTEPPLAIVQDPIPGPQPEPTPSPAEEEASDSQDRAKGVLRLLEQGHFKGVADVRLRINFAEQIAARQNEVVREVGGEQLTGLAQIAESSIAELLELPDLSPEQQQAVTDLYDAFALAVEGAQQSLATTEGTAISAILAEVGGAVDTLMADLLAVVAPADAEDPAPSDEAIGEAPAAEPTDPADDPAPSAIDAFMTDLAEVLAEAMTGLSDALTSTSLLPPVSPPTGNGVAFARFMAIYAQMQQPASPVEEVPSDTAPDIDLTA